MLAILEFYMSSFWTWAGLTIALAIITQGVVMTVAACRK